MGLTIVQQIAEAHGGTLSVSSAAETGTDVHVVAAARRVHGMSAGRILVVDDDPQIRRVMRVTLTGQGYEVDDAKNGESALEKIREERFDLVLLDMNMPGMGGLETCRAIRSQSEIAIIMLTVRDTEADKVEALDAGADDYVTKPFSAAGAAGAHPRGAAPDAVDARADAAALTLGRRRDRFRHAPGHGARPARPADAEGIRAAAVSGRPRQQGRCPHRELLQAVWGPDYGDQVDYLRVFVNQLRKKIEAGAVEARLHLLTEPWVGYRLNVPAEPAQKS